MPVYLGNATNDYNNKTVQKTNFMCADGSLIDKFSKCDRQKDCLDNSDEIDCSKFSLNNNF